jgi:hypothetical protein
MRALDEFESETGVPRATLPDDGGGRASKHGAFSVVVAVAKGARRRAPVAALLVLAFLGTAPSSFWSGRSFGQDRTGEALGQRVAEALNDPLATFSARSPGARGDVVHLTKVAAPHERVLAMTRVRPTAPGLLPASEIDPVGDGMALPDGPGAFNIFGAPATNSAGGGFLDPNSLGFPSEPDDIFIPHTLGTTGGGSGGGTGGGTGGGSGGPSGPIGPGGNSGGGTGGEIGGGSSNPSNPIGPGGGLTVSVVPEAPTWSLLIVGFLGLGTAVRRYRQLASTP